MNFYKRYMGDFARDTAHLTMLQRGAYNDMLDYYYATGRPLPAEKDQLYRIARAMNGGERKAVDSIADQFFPVSEDGLRHNKRADKEIAKQEAQAATNRELGKLGGRPRKTESVSESVSESEPKGEPNRNPNHSQNQKKQKQGAFALPDWVSPDAWKAFEDHRQKLRKPMTDRARTLILTELEKLAQAGHEPVAVLERSIRKGWQDVFPIPVDDKAAQHAPNWS